MLDFGDAVRFQPKTDVQNLDANSKPPFVVQIISWPNSGGEILT